MAGHTINTPLNEIMMPTPAALNGSVSPTTYSNESELMAAHAQSNAVIYIVVVLLVYAVALVLLMIKYVKRERDEARLSYLYDEFVRRDRCAKNKSPEVVHVNSISTATGAPPPEPERFLVLQNVSPV